MMRVALSMLIGNRAKYVGILIGVTFASLLITEQASIFTGLMMRTFGAISDLPHADVWVMDPKVQFIDDIKPLKDTELFRVRGVQGVEWAVPLYKGLLKARLAGGAFQSVNLFGLDDASLIGGPLEMVEGRLADLHNADAVIVDEVGAAGRLARVLPDGSREKLAVGDSLELNDHRAVVVGICRVSRTFQSQPVLYTTYSRATQFAPRERKLLSFVLAKAKPGEDPVAVARRIEEATGLAAFTAHDFKWKTMGYFLKYTGIPINFGTSVLLGFLVGAIIAGQTFFNFAQDNLRYFGTLKAMGATSWTLVRMVLVQALLVGAIGWGLGVGGAAAIGYLARNSELAFRMPWELLWISALVVLVICAISAVLCLVRVLRLEAGIVFRT